MSYANSDQPSLSPQESRRPPPSRRYPSWPSARPTDRRGGTSLVADGVAADWRAQKQMRSSMEIDAVRRVEREIPAGRGTRTSRERSGCVT